MASPPPRAVTPDRRGAQDGDNVLGMPQKKAFSTTGKKNDTREVDRQSEITHQQLLKEEAETNFTLEHARRACVVLNGAILSGNEYYEQRAFNLIGTWLQRGETAWVDEINTTVLFDATFEVIRMIGGSNRLSKNIKDRILKAFINRTRAARNAVEWLRCIRGALARGDIVLGESRANLEALVQLGLVLIQQTRHALTSAPRNISTKKSIELWTLHGETSAEVGLFLAKTPDGLGSALSANPKSLSKVIHQTGMSTPGSFVLRIIQALLIGKIGEPLVEEGDWLSDSALSAGASIAFSELHGWLAVCRFAFAVLGTKSPIASKVLARCSRFICAIFSAFSEIYVRNADDAKSVSLEPLSNAIDSLRELQDLATSTEVLLSVHYRHLLCKQDQTVSDAFYRVCAQLAEVGVQLVVEQCVRWGSLLMTHSWSIVEGDALEEMVCNDLSWLEASSLSRLLFDGRSLLRLASACAWPDMSPVVSDKLWQLTRNVAKTRPSDKSVTWERLCATLTERFGRPFEQSQILNRSSNPGIARDASASFAEARRVFAAFVHDERLVPTFARMDSTSDQVRIARARAFSDAVLGLLNGGDGWREDAASIFWESFLERDENKENESGVRSDSGRLDEEFRAWLFMWACRALTISTLRSRFGSAKDTFSKFEEAIESLGDAGHISPLPQEVSKEGFSDDTLQVPRRAKSEIVGTTAASESRIVLDLLFNLHREILMCASIHPDARISGFFSRNSETCQSWLLRLVSLGLNTDHEQSTSAIFYYCHYDNDFTAQRPTTWTGLVLDSLARRQEAPAIRALTLSRGDIFATGSSSKAWADAYLNFASGGYWRASEGFQKGYALLEDELEGSRTVNDEEAMRRDRSPRMAIESLMRLGEWTRAKAIAESFRGCEDLTVIINSISALADRGDNGGVLGVPLDEPLQLRLAQSPTLAFLRWCSEPSSPAVANLVKTACISASARGNRDAHELGAFSGGKVGKGSSLSVSSDANWAVLEVARRRFGLPSQAVKVASMTIRAIRAGDSDAARSLLGNARPATEDETLRDPELFVSLVRDTIGLGRSGSPIERSSLDIFLPHSLLVRRLGELDSGTGIELAMELVSSESSIDKMWTASPLALGELAMYARAAGHYAIASQLHLRAIRLGSAEIPLSNPPPVSNASALEWFVMYLAETDDSGGAEERSEALASLPMEVLRGGLTHLMARAETQLVEAALTKLAKGLPRDVVWELVAGSGHTVDAVRREMDPAVLVEAESLKSNLVEAARTFDEDWDDLLEDLAKRPWTERLMEFADTTNQPVSLVGQIRTMWRDTFGCSDRRTLSSYHQTFLDSEVGAALRTFVDHPDRKGTFAMARSAMATWMATTHDAQRDLDALTVSRASGTRFSVVPGCADAPMVLSRRVDILRTKTRPRKVGFDFVVKKNSVTRMDERKSFLLKSAEDLRLDGRLVQLWSMVCPRQQRGTHGAAWLREYLVIPLSRRVGLVEWVERAVPLFHAYREWKNKSWLLASRGANGTRGAHMEVEKGERAAVTEEFQAALTRTGGGGDKLAAFREVHAGVDTRLLAKYIWNTSRDAENWWSRSMAFASSCGSTSVLGWLVGLGDRHLDNILLELDTGRVVHVDLNVCFDKGLRLRVPETVPFRLTSIMCGALPLVGGGGRAALDHGPLGAAMVDTLVSVRSKRHAVASYLECFALDPARPQLSSSRVGALELERVEFDFLKMNFLTRARSWLAEAGVEDARMMAVVSGDESSVEDNNTREDELKQQLTRARTQAHKVATDMTRQREKLSVCFARVLSSDRVLMRTAAVKDLEAIDESSVDPSARPIARNLARAEALCIQASQTSLGRAVAAVRQFPSMTKLALPCGEWAGRLESAAKSVQQGEWDSRNNVEPTQSPLRLAISADDLADLERFKTVVASMVAGLDHDQVLVAKHHTSGSWAQRIERGLKRVNEAVALAESVIALMSEAKDDNNSSSISRAAMNNLRRVFFRSRLASVKPQMQLACDLAPDFTDFLAVCAHLRIKHDALIWLTRYQEQIKDGRLSVASLSFAAKALHEAFSRMDVLEFPQDSSKSDRAEAQARQANARVEARLDDDTEASKLAASLIDQATNERNLSEMWIGWMPFL